MIGIADIGGKQRRADPHIATLFNSASTDYHSIAMSVRIVGAGRAVGIDTPPPVKARRDRLEGCDQTAEQWILDIDGKGSIEMLADRQLRPLARALFPGVLSTSNI